MSSIVGTNVGACVVPTDTADVFPTHDSQYGKGGHTSADSTTARDAIPAARRTEGMFCYCKADQNLYELKGGTDNTNWTVFTGSDNPLTKNLDLNGNYISPDSTSGSYGVSLGSGYMSLTPESGNSYDIQCEGNQIHFSTNGMEMDAVSNNNAAVYVNGSGSIILNANGYCNITVSSTSVSNGYTNNVTWFANNTLELRGDSIVEIMNGSTATLVSQSGAITIPYIKNSIPVTDSNGTLSGLPYSYLVDWSSSANPVGWQAGFQNYVGYSRIGKFYFVYFTIYGTSNNTSTSFTLPAAVGQYITPVYFNITAQDSGSWQSSASGTLGYTNTSVTFFKDQNGYWTASGYKAINGFFMYASV